MSKKRFGFEQVMTSLQQIDVLIDRNDLLGYRAYGNKHAGNDFSRKTCTLGDKSPV